jgi:leucyl-tRNA synthetase
LLNTRDLKEWPSNVKTMQENWIGESKGCLIYFKFQNEMIQIFTTRPETIYGVTYLAISKDHPLVRDNKREGEYYTGFDAIHPLNGNKIPIYVADYVISEFGEGTVMGVPSHDLRDFEFSKRHQITSIKVFETEEECYTGSDSTLINSEQFNGLGCKESRELITKFLEEKQLGKEKTEYRIRDWLISRQRYWGAPIPILYCPECGIVPEKEENLPVLLDTEINVKCPCGKGTMCKRETDTMDTFVDSSWYFLRFIDPKNTEK